ncbi:MAG: hypothetical protein HOO06_06520 [Bdellovibrionaceae bacterium]|nr:hypothetical protein [Pseudobdellovibrionaceae bacterium]
MSSVVLPGAPVSVAELSNDAFQIKVPGGTNKWGIHLRVKLRTFMNKSILRYPSVSPVVDVKVSNIRVTGGFNYSLRDSGQFKILSVIEPKVDYDVVVKVKYNKFQGYFDKLSSKLEDNMRKKVKESLPGIKADFKQTFEGMAEFLDKPQLTANIYTKVPTDKVLSQRTIDEFIRLIDRKMYKEHSPYGILAKTVYKNSHDGKWLEDFYTHPENYNPGPVVGFNGYNDSAIWTGNYLASQSFRYMVTKSPESIKAIEHILSGLEMLLAVNGNTGLLSRAAAPADSIFGKNILKQRTNREIVMVNGREWVNHHGDRNGVSRDQYSGVYFGLSVMYDSLGNEHGQLKKRAARLVSMMTRYLIKNNWVVSEDRGEEGAPLGKYSPTAWTGAVLKLPILVIANHMDPRDRVVAKELKKFSALSESAWLSIYFAVLDPVNKYFKFNLENINFYNYLRLEKNEQRKKGMLRAHGLLEQYIGHHGNVYFRLLRRHLDPSNQKRAQESNPRAMREIFTKLLQKNHREATPMDIDYSGVPLVDYKSYDGKITKMPAGPIDLQIRYNTGSFQWQRNPFSINKPGQGTPKVGMHGMSMSMVYWMARAVNEGYIK